MTFLTLPHSSCRPWLLKASCPVIYPTHCIPSSSFCLSSKPHISVFIQINSNTTTSRTPRFLPCSAARQQQKKESSVKKRQTGGSKKKRGSIDDDASVLKPPGPASQSYQPGPASIPKPPAGFVLDKDGKVVMVSSKRMITIVDSSNNLPLECIIRRVFKSSQGDDCMLLCPVDTPVQILKSTTMKSTNMDGWSAVGDEEVEAILPAAAYALAKIHMHLVYSGFCYTARGGFCYSEEDIFEFGTDDGQDVDGLPAEGVQITCFHQDGTHYMIYTPSNPLLFVAVKDDNGLRIADDDLLEDPTIGDAIDEETEFNALVEEEAALLESLLEEEL